jgi:hypothetical protein
VPTPPPLPPVENMPPPPVLSAGRTGCALGASLSNSDLYALQAADVLSKPMHMARQTTRRDKAASSVAHSLSIPKEPTQAQRKL